jgi:hypothetical protein
MVTPGRSGEAGVEEALLVVSPIDEHSIGALAR